MQTGHERPVAVRLLGTSKGRAAVCTRCSQYRKGEFFISFSRTPLSAFKGKERRRRRGQFLTCVLCRQNKAWAADTTAEKNEWFSKVAHPGDYSLTEELLAHTYANKVCTK